MILKAMESSVFSQLPYQELREICFGPSNFVQSAIDCNWGVWRDRAYFLLGIPYSYFDIPRLSGISGVQRYIEISTYGTLSSLSLITIYEDGLMEGIYESLAALLEAIKRDDINAVGLFLPYLSPEAVNVAEKIISFSTEKDNFAAYSFFSLLGKHYSLTSKGRNNFILNNIIKGNISLPIYTPDEDLLTLIMYGNEQALEEALRRNLGKLSIIKQALKSGRISFVDTVLPLVFPNIPQGFSIVTIPLIPFQTGEKEPFPLVILPFSLSPQEKELASQLIPSALFGSNPQVVDFFRSLYSPEILPFAKEIFSGYFFHRLPVETYSILQRALYKGDVSDILELIHEVTVDNLDLILLLLDTVRDQQESNDYIFSLENYILTNEGNVSILVTLTDLLITALQEEKKGKEEIKERLREINGNISHLFPISKRLLGNLISSQ